MIEYEDMCVGCPPEIGCLGDACPNKNVPVPYCDECNTYADYIVEGKYYCEHCLREQMKREFEALTTEEMLDGFEYIWEEVSDI